MIIITLSKFSRGINGLWAKVKSHVSTAISGMVISESTGSLPEGELDTEMVRNKVTSLSSQSTDTQYPSAKCVYDALEGYCKVMNLTQAQYDALAVKDNKTLYNIIDAQ